MKKLAILFSIMIITISTLIGQGYIQAEKIIYTKSDFQIGIQFFNMNVNISNNPTLRLYRDLDTFNLPVLYNATFSGLFEIITDSLNYGYYGVIYQDNINGVFNKPNEIFYTNSEYSIPEPTTHLQPDSVQWVEINLSNSINMSNIDSIIILNRKEKIKCDSNIILGNDYFKFLAPIGYNSAGMYDLQIYRSDSIMRFFPDYFYIKNFNESFIYPEIDTLSYYNVLHPFFLYGKNTHFLSSLTSVNSDNHFSWIQIFDTIIINDTTIELLLCLPMGKTPIYFHSFFSIYNPIDGYLKCPIVFPFVGSINETQGSYRNLKIYPNPSTDYIILESPDFETYKKYIVEISTLEGKSISKQEYFGNKQLIINNLNLQKGAYLLQIKSENQSESKLLVIE
jgi:hypothetical protein